MKEDEVIRERIQKATEANKVKDIDNRLRKTIIVSKRARGNKRAQKERNSGILAKKSKKVNNKGQAKRGKVSLQCQERDSKK